jgi:hypothetical protein
LVLDLGASIINADGDTDFDFIYFERSDPSGTIYFDWLAVDISNDLTGPWHRVFFWGDTITDTNTNLGQNGYGPGNPPIVEEDNLILSATNPPFTSTAGYTTGVAIDVDNSPLSPLLPSGSYRYVRFYAPPGGADPGGPEIDAVRILP